MFLGIQGVSFLIIRPLFFVVDLASSAAAVPCRVDSDFWSEAVEFFVRSGSKLSKDILFNTALQILDMTLLGLQEFGEVLLLLGV